MQSFRMPSFEGRRRPIPLRFRSTAALAAASLVLGTAALATPVLTATPAHADESTISVDPLRTGWDPKEPGLMPAQVSSADFHRLFSTKVDGSVYAQPVIAGSTVVVATENNNAVGINATSGRVTWSRSLGSPWPASVSGCGDLVPNIGVTSTPVYDTASGTVYLIAKKNDGPNPNHPHWYVHAIDAATGGERRGWPVQVHGAPVNDPQHAFNSLTAMQRPGLLLMGGSIYAGFASNCDHGPYVGYVMGINTSTRGLTLWSTERSSGNGEAGVWMSGGGLVSDGPGRIFLSTGNGASPAPGPGSRPPGELAESVVRLEVTGNGTLAARDFFSPSNAEALDKRDTDLGSGGPAGLPSPAFGNAAHPHLMVEVGKDGRVFLLDRDDLGGRGQGPHGSDKVLGTFGPFSGVWGHPGVWGGDGGYVYMVGSRGPLRAFKYGTTGDGRPTLSSAATSKESFGYTSGSPVVTSTGTTSGSALVWSEYASGSNGTRAQLRAYDAVPVNGTMRLRFSAPIGTASKFAVPATDGGRVYVGTRDGHLLAFGRPTQAALLSNPVGFGDVSVGAVKNATVTVTATRPVTVTSVSVPQGAPFATAQSTGSLPRTLSAGQRLSVPVSFAPTTPGRTAGAVTFHTNLGPIGVDLSGNGTRSGFSASPPSLAFGALTTGTSQTLGTTITNTGTTPETVSGTTLPCPPFSVSGLPAVGTTLAPGNSFTVQVTYAPTSAGNNSSSLTISGAGGSATVPLTGNAASGQGRLTITPTHTDFGKVPVGRSLTKTFDIANQGNVPLTISKAAPPAGAFITSNPISEGQVLAAGEVVHQSVTFRPERAGTATGTYQIASDDGRGPQNEFLTGTGVRPSVSAHAKR